MKRLFLFFGLLTAFMLVMASGLQAQENSGQNQIIVIQKATNDDGSVTIKKKRFEPGDSPDKYFQELKLEDGGSKKIELTVITDGENEDGAETMLLIRSGDGDEELIIKGSGDFDQEDFDFDFDFDDGENSFHFDHGNGTCSPKHSKALIGIYPERVENGVLVTSLVYGGGARAAGIEEGDVMTSIDGRSLSGDERLNEVMMDYRPGDVIAVEFLRDGQTMTTDVTLTERGKTNKRNPCKVFIGVSLGSSDGESIRISGIIDGWPAEDMALVPGDRIVAFDGVKVGGFDELLVQRNKHQAGDAFTMTILRDGETFVVDGQFKECPDEPEMVQPVPLPETAPEPEIGSDVEFTDNSLLDIGGFDAYPNPTAGMLNVRFRGEPVPTVVTVTDINGQLVFQEKVDDFDGYYSKEINLSKGTPGAMTVTVRQGGQVQSKQVVLLSRAWRLQNIAY